MDVNVGVIDRVVRFLLGVFLLAAPFVFAAPFWSTTVVMFGSVLIGAILLTTGVVGICPLYSLLGKSTRRLT